MVAVLEYAEPVCVTLTALVTLGGASGSTLIATGAAAPAATVPIEQLSVRPLRVHEPWLGVADT